MYVLDSSAIISGLKFPPEEVIIPRGVLDEIKDKTVEFEIYRILDVDKKYVEKVKKTARDTGDFEVLSSVDFEVLALALQEKAIIVTDDYAIQNVASHMGIRYQSAQMQEIKEARKWKWRCTSCGRYFRRYYDVCPVCGGKLKRVKSKGRCIDC